MNRIEAFIRDLDKAWPESGEQADLLLIGSGALMLQSEMDRGTKDGDILETPDMREETKTRLVEIGGRESKLFRKHRMYLDIVKEAILFLPSRPRFFPIASLSDLHSFNVSALDVVDVVVSKMKRFNGADVRDIAAMVKGGFVSHERMIESFRASVDAWSMDARAEDLPKCLDNLHVVERDFFHRKETEIDLPTWIE